MKTAFELSVAVRQGEISATEATQQSLAAIEARDTEIGAFVQVLGEEAMESAAQLDSQVAKGMEVGPLAGVPIALKDNMCTRGFETTCCSKILQGWKPPYDATVVQKLRQAGAIIVGKTNMDEFAMGSSTENSIHPPTRNPWDTTRVPGGSSGGSAAAVAADFVPLSLGSDTGGSIRQPAALCGVVGVKPTYGRVSRYGLIAFASSLDQIGPFANNVLDSALLLEAIAGHDPADSTSIPANMGGTMGTNAGSGKATGGVAGVGAIGATVAATGEPDVKGLRVGIVKEFQDVAATDVADRVSASAAALAEAGAQIEEVSLPDALFGLSAYYLLATAEASSNLARYDGVRYGLRVAATNAVDMKIATRTTGFGQEVKRRIMLGTFALSAGYYDAYYGKALKVRTLIIRDFARAYEKCDVLLAPTSPTTAFELGAKTDNPLEMYKNDICTIPSSLAGHPAMSVPFGLGADGLPVGVQVLAPALAEARMFQTAIALEQLSPSVSSASN